MPDVGFFFLRSALISSLPGRRLGLLMRKLSLTGLCTEQAAKMRLQGFGKDQFGCGVIDLAGARQSSAAGVPKMVPTGGAVAAAPIMGRIDKGLQQHGAKAPVIVPVIGQAPGQLAQHMTGQVMNLYPGQDGHIPLTLDIF